MQQLVKPSEYAKMHGLSRQSVYAKIKRGTLPSRKVDGRYYVIVAEAVEKSMETSADEEPIEHVSLIDEYREIIRAKDETIEVLKQSIDDLKEANAQITQTLQQEITLLKQAFNEMKALYAREHLLAEHVVETAENPAEEAIVEPLHAEKEPSRKKNEKKRKKQAKKGAEEECWLPLGDLIQRQKYHYNKAKQVVKRFKKAYKKGDPRIKKQNGIFYISCYDFYEDILE
jgi:predicted DNA-binding transcriptional regulator AlpA